MGYITSMILGSNGQTAMTGTHGENYDKPLNRMKPMFRETLQLRCWQIVLMISRRAENMDKEDVWDWFALGKCGD